MQRSIDLGQIKGYNLQEEEGKVRFGYWDEEIIYCYHSWIADRGGIGGGLSLWQPGR